MTLTTHVFDFLVLWKAVVVPVLILVLYGLGLLASGHILLTKRDPRASLGWIVVCLGFPGLGVIFYLLFGVNRVKTRGQDWISTGLQDRLFSEGVFTQTSENKIPDSISQNPVFHQLRHVADSVTVRPLLSGCHITALHNGEEAYPQMLSQIDGAKKSVYLVTYIFETNTTGQLFIDALSRAQKRGVDVRVLIDGFGNLYSWPSAYRLLKKNGVRVVKFLPFNLSKHGLHLNLRNHRKIMVVDGEVGFTGGMNIGDRHLVKNRPPQSAVQDVHFKVTGPVVGQLQDTFLIDWYFCTRDEHTSITHNSTHTGQALCRGIADAPDNDFEKIRLTLIGAITSATQNIRIMTPYFIPDAAMISALNAASLKGVSVEIILPKKNNLPYVKWASQAYFWELLQHNVHIYYQPLPFAHSKFLVIDDFYSLVGSANLDPRSLRLNFEFNLEVYDHNFAKSLITHFISKKSVSQTITKQMMESRSVWIKLRDGFFKLFSPYL